MRVFLDTNVLASAFGTRGLCTDVVRLVLAEHELVISEFVLDELAKALRQKFGVPDATVQEILVLLRTCRLQSTPAELPKIDVRDRDDLAVLGAAMAAGADALVTGDKDLLAIKEQLGIQITNPRGFWEMLKRKSA